MRELEGKTAFVTGWASGIGLGIAQAAGEAGMRVVLGDIRPDHLENAVAAFEERDRVRALELDVTDREAFARAADAAEEAFGQAPAAVATAGVGIPGPI